jgi:hypothetical protein
VTHPLHFAPPPPKLSVPPYTPYITICRARLFILLLCRLILRETALRGGRRVQRHAKSGLPFA